MIHRPFVIISLLLLSSALSAEQTFIATRQEMISAIHSTVADTSGYTGIAKLDDKVIHAMATVPRHEFVPESLRKFAYLNRPLPIGARQTISQPYIVALMTQLAEVDAAAVVLEVGTGSGYQAAVLSVLVKQVYTMEIVNALGVKAKNTLARLGYDNVQVIIGDGYDGWKQQAPYDAILVTAAPERVPGPLLAQLKTGGRMVIPVGAQNRTQSLQVLEKLKSGEVITKDILPVGFVPFTRR